LKYFGGEKLITMMQNMGMKKDEAIEHTLITQSIANAQEKIEAKVSIEQSTRSQAEWMERNLK
jgi:preprotein translocase subunit SecA